MKLSEPLRGACVTLRTALEEDAEFMLELRMDPRNGRFLSPTHPDPEQQRAWIRGRLAAEDDYACVIEDAAGQRIGTIALYHINRGAGTCEWGRWILAPGAPALAALESAMLIYRFAFFDLGLKRAEFGVMGENTRVISFHRGMGARPVAETDVGVHFHFLPEDFAAACRKYGRRLSPRICAGVDGVPEPNPGRPS